MTREEYFEYGAVSRSLLVELNKHPKAAKRMMDEGMNEESEALLIGDAFDTLMFDGQEVFDEKFHIMKLENPFTDGRTLLGKYMNSCIELVKTSDHTISDIYSFAYELVKTKTSNEDTLREEFKNGGGTYYLSELKTSLEKPTLTQDQYNQLIAMKYQLLDNPFVNRYFVENPIKGAEKYHENNCDLYYQLPILWTEDGVECKALLDIVEVDHEKKVITPIDLKTTSAKNHSFDGSIIKYEYYYQAAFYHLAIENWKNIHYPDYKVTNFRFVFSEKSCTFEPLIYQMNENDINIATYGGQRNGYPVRGIKGLLNDLKWHMENDLWEYRKAEYESNGVIISDLFDPIDVWDMISD